MHASSVKPALRWVSRILPPFLIACVGVVTYTMVARICLNYFMKTRKQTNVVIALLVVYFLLFFVAFSTFLRLVIVVKFHAALVPIARDEQARLQRENELSEKHTLQTASTRPFSRSSRPFSAVTSPHTPRTPVNNGEPLSTSMSSMASFYTRDVFVCDFDGRPRWCPGCLQFKPDRAHHSSDMGRCVYKMDHFCPWVGGIVDENSFKFFVQFVTYAALYWISILVPSVFVLVNQLRGPFDMIDPFMIVTVALSGFLGLFSFAMSVTSIRLVLVNQTTVEGLESRTKVYYLAVRVDSDFAARRQQQMRAPASANPSGNSQWPQSVFFVSFPLPSDQAHGGPIHERLTQSPSQAQINRRLASPNHVQITGSTTRPATHLELSSEESDVTIPLRAVPNNSSDGVSPHIFAVVSTDPGTNPWNIDWRTNWCEVMGYSPLQWLVPLTKSPCTNHGGSEGFYRVNRDVLNELRAKYDIEPLSRHSMSRRRSRRRARDRQRYESMDTNNFSRSGSAREVGRYE